MCGGGGRVFGVRAQEGPGGLVASFPAKMYFKSETEIGQHFS